MAPPETTFIVVDTNVFIEALALIERLCVIIAPISLRIYVTATVLAELDGLKAHSAPAREAARYLNARHQEENSSICLEKEGDAPARTTRREGHSNDDAIVDACSRLKGAVLLTNDVVMQLKARAKNVRCMGTRNKSAEALFREINRESGGVVYMECEADGEGGAGGIQKKACDYLYWNVVKPTFAREVGEEMVDHFLPNRGAAVTLSSLLKLVLKHYGIFSSVLPRNGRLLVQEISQKIQDPHADVRAEIKTLFALFGLDVKGTIE